jgi:hypothetical protein
MVVECLVVREDAGAISVAREDDELAVAELPMVVDLGPTLLARSLVVVHFGVFPLGRIDGSAWMVPAVQHVGQQRKYRNQILLQIAMRSRLPIHSLLFVARQRRCH